jgi:hypothetical protein
LEKELFIKVTVVFKVMNEDYYSDISEPKEESELQKKIRKITKTAISVLLIVLMLSFIIPQEVVSSLIESNKIENYQINLKTKTIYFTHDAYEKLKQYYFYNQLTEFKVCLTGEINGTNYFVTSFYSPTTFFKTPTSVSSELCNNETIIALHTHPYRNCIMSEQDILTYKKYEKALGAVMCDTERFTFYEA